MFNLNPFAISGLLIIVTYFPLFLFILTKGKTKVARIFSLHILAVFCWGLGAFLNGINTNPDISINLWKFAYASVTLIPVFLYHAVILMTRRKALLEMILIYSQAIYFLFMLAIDKMIPGNYYLLNSIYWMTGSSLYIYSCIAWGIIASTAHLKLLAYYKKCYPKEKRQISALIFAIIGFVGGANNFLPGLGIKIYPYGNFLVPIHSMLVTYAILKHQLLDIHFVFKKGIIYTALLILISSIYLSLVLGFEKILQGHFNYHSTLTSIIAAFFIGILFFPLRNRVQALVDKYFFKRSPSEIAAENLMLRREVAEKEKFKAVSTLASGLSHEIKNPLTAITTFAEFLPDKLNDKEFLRKFARIVGNEAGRINNLVEQLNDFAKPAAPKPEKTNIHQLLNDTLDFLNSKFIHNRVEVVKNFIPEDLILNVDPNLIRQAVLNIILNALDAMPSGGTLTIETKWAKIIAPGTDHQTDQRSSVSKKQSAIICVRDTGVGINKKDLKNIFDPFFTKKDEGTGLGLAVTQGIMEDHGGQIKIESTVEVGTSVILEFDLK
ncbi:MAG: hypothetical protein KAJ18_02960 [Candidatus Omnitrophica bacterium]|nr:hypothetical protein [Candidatus Omnitrophota bacterium]